MYFWVFFFVKNVLHTVSVYLLEFFSLYIFHFVILCCFSVTHVYVAFPFLVGSCNCWRKNFFFLFLFLFYCQYYITVQICVDMKKTIFGGQFKYRYIETLVYKLLVSIVGCLESCLESISASSHSGNIFLLFLCWLSLPREQLTVYWIRQSIS